jgi:hypothetical protein
MAADVVSCVFIAGRGKVLVAEGAGFRQECASKIERKGLQGDVIRCSRCDRPAAQLDLDAYPSASDQTLCDQHWD